MKNEVDSEKEGKSSMGDTHIFAEAVVLIKVDRGSIELSHIGRI